MPTVMQTNLWNEIVSRSHSSEIKSLSRSSPLSLVQNISSSTSETLSIQSTYNCYRKKFSDVSLVSSRRLCSSRSLYFGGNSLHGFREFGDGQAYVVQDYWSKAVAARALSIAQNRSRSRNRNRNGKADFPKRSAKTQPPNSPPASNVFLSFKALPSGLQGLDQEDVSSPPSPPTASSPASPPPPPSPASSVRPPPHQRGRFLLDDVGPNPLLLEALAVVCTGPEQTRPLDETKIRRVLQTVIASVKGELPVDERTSKAQLGAFFGGMTLRANVFPPPTRWNAAEAAAMAEFWPELRKHLPKDLLFLADPEGSIMGGLSPIGPTYIGEGGKAEQRLVSSLREILVGGHLGFEETQEVLKDILPLRGMADSVGGKEAVSDALVAAFLICQRMNRETDRELKAYCMAFEDDAPPLANVSSLTHYGEPYDGNTRFFRPTLFIAAVRASYGEACLLHGVDWMPPKGGVTEEQMLMQLGASTTLSPADAARLLEDQHVGFAYVSLREARPAWYSLIDLRLHIKKRPPLATTEKVQRLVHATGREAMMAGFYHEGYEEPLLMLIRRQDVAAGLVIKGEEGGLQLMTRPKSGDAVVKGRPVNYCAGFRPMNPDGLTTQLYGDDDDAAVERRTVFRETFSLEFDASKFGFSPSATPRIDRSAAKNLELGLSALNGERGPAFDRIVLNAAMADHLLGCRGAEDPKVAIARAEEAVLSGKALKHLQAYVRKSHKIASRD